MAILKRNKDNVDFTFKFNINNDDVTIEIHGGNNVSSQQIACMLYGLFNGKFNDDIFNVLVQWGKDGNEEKLINILNILKSFHGSESQYCIHPLNVFNHQKHINGNIGTPSNEQNDK